MIETKLNVETNPTAEALRAPTVAICTLGCRVNQYESRAIAEAMQSKGFVLREFGEKSDVYVINTCAVTAESERKSRQMARRAHKCNPDAVILVTGCQSQLHPDAALAIKGVRYVGGNASKLEVAEAAARLISDRELVIDGRREITAEYECYAVKLPDHTRAYVKIEDGCKNKCAYCVIPKVRGPVRSKPFDDVVSEVKALAELGFKEIVLTGIEVCDYQYNLKKLISTLSEVNGIERLRLASVNPAFINPEFADCVKEIPKLCHHFHLSLQSYCNRTLRAMRRQYNVAMLKRNVSYLRSVMPDVAFTADIICGFPGESEDDFAETLKNVSELGLIHAHIFPYSPRPETEAATMPEQIDEQVKNKRCAQLSALCENMSNNIIEGFKAQNKPFSVLFEESKNGFSYGHTENFIEVAVRSDIPLDGNIYQVSLKRRLEGSTTVWEAALCEADTSY